jgi:hypothetical protein
VSVKASATASGWVKGSALAAASETASVWEKV